MKTPITITILKTIEANQETEGHTEVKIWVDHSEAKFLMAEASVVRANIKASIKLSPRQLPR